MTTVQAHPAAQVVPRDTAMSVCQSRVWSTSDLWLHYRLADSSVTRGLNVVALFNNLTLVAQSCASDNWDGEGARAVDTSTVGFARMFASGLPGSLPSPDISADNDGDISFEWNYGPRRVFSVSVRRDGVLNYALLLGTKREHGSDIIFPGVPSSVIQHIARVSEG
jgi:hypothetical protein